MESITSFFLRNWQRKLLALLLATVMWFFINHSINGTKTLSNIPVRVIHLPKDKTVQGLLSNGILSRRMTLTLSGTKDVVADLEPGDLEVVLDASTAESDDWVVHVTKKNLISLDPSVDLPQHINQVVSHSEFVIKLSPLVTAEIPITILPPRGNPPNEYEYLDIWPQHLVQTISGPEEEIHRLQLQGLELAFDLEQISKEDLDSIRTLKQGLHGDEISFYIPKNWKQVVIPFLHYAAEEVNDPEANFLRIDFLYRELLPVEREIPIRVFYPSKTLSSINPETLPLAVEGKIRKNNGVTLWSAPLYARDVSRLFLDLVRKNMEITIIASKDSSSKEKQNLLEWSIDFINIDGLEDAYVALYLSNLEEEVEREGSFKQQEPLLRKRFNNYLQQIKLFRNPEHRFKIESVIENNQIKVLRD